MKIECIQVCQGYSDFLAETLPINLPQVDRMVIVTHPDDKATQALCSKYSVECIQTVCMHRRGDRFNKGEAISLGLGHMRADGWILHLDADIVLPHTFRQMLDRAELNPTNLYGADRINVYGWERWQKLKPELIPHYSSRYFIAPPSGHPVGARIVHSQHGYTPIGYFQLWWGALQKRYPLHQGSGEHSDVLFACQWARSQRILLPEVLCYHLDSRDGPHNFGENWGGRRSPPFGPCHKHHHHPHPYCPHEDWQIQEKK